jgi:hypothetical protein
MVGLLLTLGVTIPVVVWWGRIRSRKKAEEKRITL